MSKLYTENEKYQCSYDEIKINKDPLIFDCLGDLDELSSQIGLLCTTICWDYQYILKELRLIQVNIIDIITNISLCDRQKISVPIIDDSYITNIEELICTHEKKNKKIPEFVPGFFVSDAQSHICRSITRRVERSLWKINNAYETLLKNNNPTSEDLISIEKYKIEPNIKTYINRLSDYFFSLAIIFSDDMEVKVSDIKNL
jgi:cob(I)alamin adenosyltransferase